jgi:phospholipid/cholesterol/gamma-HCH transport system substrate-binding protein
MPLSKTQDTLVGLFVACGIAGLFFMALQISNLGNYNKKDIYTISARFDNAGGLKVKAPVAMAGVRIGRITAITFDKKSYQAVVEMSIESKYDTLPDDTTASVFTSGLLGEQYISLEPGGSDEYLADKGEIDITQSAMVLEQLIGQFLFKANDSDSKD